MNASTTSFIEKPQTQTPDAGAEMYLHNMRMLWRHDPTLAMRVDAVHDEERFTLEPTRSNAWTVKMSATDDQEIYLHSRYDPESEAKKLADTVEIKDKFCFVITGLGLGYHVLALFERLKGDVLIVCVEPSIEIIATAMACLDFTKLIETHRFIILTDTDKSRLHERLQPYNALIMLGAEFLNHPSSRRIAVQQHNAITTMISEFFTYTRMTLLTLVSNSKITCQNIAMNFCHIVSTPPIDILKDRFAGNPAIVISAGPSLAKSIDLLEGLKGNAILVAVQTTIKPLLKKGIVPDFVTSLDFHEMSQKFFDSVEGLDQVHLVAEPKATWHVLDEYPGPVSLLDNSWMRMVIGDRLAARGGLKAGATVAHLAYYLAVYMGCNPIIFVGQDLAFTGHVFYVPGVEIHQSWRSEINRFQTMEHKEWDRIVRNRPILRRVLGQDGNELYTDELLFTYLEQFEKDITEFPNQVINASEGGANIRGTKAMSLSKAIEQFCHQPIDPERFAYRKTTIWRDHSRLQATKIELERRISEIDEAENNCNEILELLEQLTELTHDPVQFNRRMIRIDELRTKVHQESLAYRIVNSTVQLAELRRFSADRKITTAEMDEIERAKHQIKRDQEFVTGVRDGALEVNPILKQSLQRVIAMMESA